MVYGWEIRFFFPFCKLTLSVALASFSWFVSLKSVWVWRLPALTWVVVVAAVAVAEVAAAAAAVAWAAAAAAAGTWPLRCSPGSSNLDKNTFRHKKPYNIYFPT